ncbi:unnamed protein product [Moneuplotes crassus]|uniref:AP2/ERF domain-containing protein n=1 Tax=Euplotes crassus TaxID=5936 RepID=A0AAD2D723_EUPCR|nr:unnamed protein product [Moneuplotes crassus]
MDNTNFWNSAKLDSLSVWYFFENPQCSESMNSMFQHGDRKNLFQSYTDSLSCPNLEDAQQPKEIINQRDSEKANKNEGDAENGSLRYKLANLPSRPIALKKEPQLKDNSDTSLSQGLKKRKSRVDKLDIKPGLLKLRKGILNNMHKNATAFTQSRKKTRFTSNINLGRRSRYIGVTKNNTHWQALINVKKSKKYIGTFSNDIEAARTYDLFSLAIKGERALINFNYTADEMLESIDHYLSHNCIKP